MELLDIKKKVLNYLYKEKIIPKDTPTENFTLFKSGKIESIQLVQIILDIEQIFKFEINDEDISEDVFNDTDNLCDFIFRQLDIH